MTPGSLLIQLSAVLALVAFVAAVRWARGNDKAEGTFRLAYYGLVGSLLLASALLMIAILRHDFRFAYVVDFSSRDLPLIYLISSFWAGQSGTFLLWALMSAVMGVFLYRRNTWQRAMVMATYIPTVGFLLALMLDPGGNPFRLVPRVPLDGHGLNQLLQDPWMASHPPAVFLGYAALTIPAVLAFVALIRNEDEKWLAPALRWSLAGFITLGVGIILGGFWAYKVLGWGGYWGWDPVENASLIPWITVTALVHGLLVQRRTGALRRTNLGLALGSYILVVYATFLTRSGVLADFSVHSFPKGTLFQVLVGGMLTIVVASAWAMAWRWKREAPAVPFTLNWPMVMSSMVLILSLSGLLVATATSWPIISPWLSGQASAIETSFYNKVNLPLFILIFAFLAVAPLLTWVGPARSLARRLAIPVILAATATGIVFAMKLPVTLTLPLFFFAVMAVATSTMRLVHLGRNNLLHTGAPMAHIGFALMFVGIVGSSSWSADETVTLPLGQPVEVHGTTLTYTGHIPGSEPKHRWGLQVGDPAASPKQFETTLYKVDEPGQDASFIRKPAIVRSPVRDLYLIATGIERPQGDAHEVELHKNTPVMLHDTELIFKSFGMAPTEGDHSMTVTAEVQVTTGEDTATLSLPFTATEDGNYLGTKIPVPGFPGATLAIQRMSVDEGVILVRADEGAGASRPETMTVQAGSKPLMSILWIGTLLLCLGCLVAVVRRVREARTQEAHGEQEGQGTQPARRRAAIAAV
jgi:cytochrome c-type biogenesis protein CcmF